MTFRNVGGTTYGGPSKRLSNGKKRKGKARHWKLHALPICFGGSFTSGRFPMELLSVAAKMSPSALWCADLRLFGRLI